MIKSAKKIYLLIAFIVALLTLTSCIVVNNHKVQLEKTEFELREGQTVDAVAWVTKDAKEVDVEVGYQSYDPSIATYIDGKITAIKAGEVRIKAYILNNPKIYTVANVKVVEDDSQRVTFDYEKQMIVGDSQIIKYSFEIEKDRVLTFTSSNNNVATVDEFGKVTALAKGQATITTKVESLYDEGCFREYQLTIDVDYAKYEITYYLNGGVNSKDNPKAYAAEELPIQLDNPTRGGFTFLGWFDNPEYDGNPIYEIAEGTTGALTLYAKWSAADYRIEYKLNGGKNNKNNPDGYSLGGLPIVLLEPTKNGYTFIGWYSGNEQIKEIKEGTTGNISVEAKWKVNTYNVSYTLNNGANNALNPSEYTAEQLPIKLQEPTRLGYQFTGWLVNGNPATEIASETTGDLNIEATWEVVSYKITLNTLGGTLNGTVPGTYTIEDKTIVLPSASKNGYTFLGWFDGENKVTDVPASSTGDKEFEAKWSINTYTIATTLNGGTLVANVPTNYTVEDATIVLPLVEKVGYEFLGWFEGNEEVKSINKGSYKNYDLIAMFKAVDYKVTYNLNGGTLATANPETFTIESETFVLNNPTKLGYTFLGWFEGANKVETIEQGTHKDYDLEAKWEVITYKVTYNDPQNVENANATTVTVEDEITLVNLVKEGYVFSGWYTDAEYQNKVEMIAKGTANDVVLYAQWNIVTYTVTFDSNGGTAVDTVEFTVEAIVLSFAEPTKVGYTFDGWYNADGQKVTSVEEGTAQNIALTAKWNIVTYTVTFDSNGGTTVDTIEFTVEGIVLSFAEPTKVGYTFDGWYNADGQKVTSVEEGTAQNIALTAKWNVVTYTVTFDSNGGTAVDTVEFTVEAIVLSFAEPTKVGYTFDGWYNADGQKVTSVEEGTAQNIALTAKWNVVTYTVTFDSNGGTAVDTVEFTVEAIVLSFAEPTKVGYTFDGWYNADGQKVTSVEEGTAQNIALTAKWQLNEYSIQYVLGENASNSEANPVSYTYVSETITLATPTRTGYIFLGWFDNEACTGTAITEIASGSTGNKTLYASWKVGTFNVTYELNGGQFAYLSREDMASDFLKDYNEFARTSYTTVASIHADSQKTNFWKNSEMRAKWLWIWDEIRDVAVNQGFGDNIKYIDNLIAGTSYSAYAMQNTSIYFLGVNATIWNADYKATYGGLSSSYTTIDATNLSETGYISYMENHENDAFNIGDNAVLPTPYRQGYTFDGWYLDEALTNKVTGNITSTTKLYANWKINTYTIEYELNDGKWEDANNVLEIDLRNAQLLKEFNIKYYLTYQSSGYDACINDKVSFGAWWNFIALKETDVKGLYEIKQIVSQSKNVTVEYDLVISWHSALTDTALKSTLNSMLSNASTYVGQYVVLEDVPSSATSNANISVSIYKNGTFNIQKKPNDTANIGSSLTLTTPLKAGFEFKGWYLTPNFSGSPVTEVTEATTVYAKWELIVPTHTINYQLNGGIGTNLPTEFIEGTTVTLVNPTRESYEFAGWYTNVECTGTPVTMIGSDVVTDVTLYAKWILLCEVNFEYNGGNLIYATREELISDLISDLNLVTGKSYTAESYASLGSWSDINGYNLFYSSKYPEMRTKWLWLAKFFSENGGQNNKSAFNAILKYANYSEFTSNSSNNIYAVTYELRGFVGGIKYTKNANYHTADYSDSTIVNSCWSYLNVTTLTVREGYTLPTNIYRTNYIFKGWYDNPEFNGEPITTINASTNVYAKWEEMNNKHNVSFELNGGRCEELPTEFMEGQSISLPVPTREGYRFLGWFNNEGCTGTAFTEIPATTTTDVTYYASWGKIVPSKDGELIVDANDMTAYETIADALAVAEEGYVIKVAAGTYSEELNITVSNITIMGPNAGVKGQDTRTAEAVITGAVTIAANNVVLDGLKFSEGGAIKLGASDNVTITNAYIDATPVKAGGTNRYGSITTIADCSNILVSNTYMNSGTNGSQKSNIASDNIITNFVVENSLLENNVTNASALCEAIQLYKIAGEIIIKNNVINCTTDNYALYLGTSYNKATLIEIKDNEFNGYNNVHTAGLRIQGLGAGAVFNFIHNHTQNMAGNTFNFASSNSASEINIMYNYFGGTYPYKLSTPGSGKITYKDNFYEVAQTTATSDYGVIRSLEELEVAYAKSLELAVNYELDGGQLSEDAPTTFNPKTGLETLPTPTRTGYEFAGWYTNNQLVTEISAGTNEEVTLTAHWNLVTYEITYNLDGGINSEENPMDYTIESDTIILKNPTKTGYEFAGWFNGTTQIETIEKGSLGNLTLTAMWNIKKYIVRFSDGVASQEVAHGSTATLPAQPTKDGYNFVEWQLNGATFNFESEVTCDLELTAKWELFAESIATLVFPGDTTDKVSAYDKTWIAKSNGNEWNVSNFNNNSFNNNWTYIKCGSKNNASMATITNAMAYNQKIVKIVVTFDSINLQYLNSMVLHVSKDIDFTNIIDKIEINTSEISVGEFTIELPNPTAGCFYKLEFDCAKANANGIISISKVEYFSLPLKDSDKLELDVSEIVINETVTDSFTLPLEGSNGSTISWSSSNEEVIKLNGSTATVTRGNIDNKVTLTAKLELNGIEKVVTFEVTVPMIILSHTVQFDTDGGTVIDSQVINENEKVSRPEDPTKEGYTFVEWQLNGTTYNFDEIVVDDITLKAVWIKDMPQLDHEGTSDDPYSVADAIKVAEQLSANEFSNSVVYVKGVVKSISYNANYDNYEIVIIDEFDSTFKLYRAIKTADIDTPYQNDIIVASGYVTNYSGNTPELSPNNNVNPSIESVKRGESKITFTYDNQGVEINPITSSAANGADVVFIVTTNEGYFIESVKVNGNVINGSDGQYSFVIGGDSEVVITSNKENGPMPKLIATFTLGADGAVSHNDGSSKTEYTETNNDYNLKIENGSNFYTGARDAKGNGCIKLGTSSKAGSFTFTVDDNVKVVKIYVSKYKTTTNNASIKINDGTAIPLTKASNDGEYDIIEIDTSTNKTISFAVSSGNRAMVNTIEFYGLGDTSDKTDEEKLTEAVEDLTISETVNGITTLPSEGTNGAIITWVSNDTNVISINDDGSITVNPQSDDTVVTLTATITINGKFDTKNFEITVSKITKHTVLFDTDGGSDVESQDVLDGKTISKPEDPTKEGYTFVEWQLNGTTYNFDEIVVEDITLKAVWNEIGVEKTEKTYTYDFVSGAITTSSGTKELNGLNWNYTESSAINFDKTKGVQIGTAKNPTSSFSLTTNDIVGKVKSITINASYASGGDATLTISVGGTKCLDSHALTTSATDYEVSCDASGEIVISFAATAKAFYIKSITIVYEE